MGVQADQPQDSKVVRILKRLEALLPYLDVSTRVHEKHDEEHDMASETSSLSVHNRPCSFLTYLRALHVDHVDIMSCSVYDRPEQYAVCDLTVEPDVFIKRNSGDRDEWTNEADNIAQDWDRALLRCAVTSTPYVTHLAKPEANRLLPSRVQLHVRSKPSSAKC